MSTIADIRRATRADRDMLHALQVQSIRELGAAYYDKDVIEAFIANVGTMDDRLLDDGTFFAAYFQGELVGCGGWTHRKPSYATHMATEAVRLLRPVATVRSIFVHPAFARRGFARRLMRKIETDIIAAGFVQASMAATLCGVPFYRQIGYRSAEPVVLRLPADLLFVGISMSKHLDRIDAELAA